MSRTFENLREQPDEGRSRRRYRMQDNTELDLFAFSEALRAREHKQEKKPPEPPPPVVERPPPEEDRPPPSVAPPIEADRELPSDEPAPYAEAPVAPGPQPVPEPGSQVSKWISPQVILGFLAILLIYFTVRYLANRSAPTEPQAAPESAQPAPEAMAPEPAFEEAIKPAAEPATPPVAVAVPAPSPALSIPGVVLRQEGNATLLVFSAGLFSKLDQLTPEARRTLTFLARDLKPLASNRSIAIVGHTDNEKVKKNALFKTNEELGLMRAKAVAAFLQSQTGLPAASFKVIGRGSPGAPYSNATPADRMRNRTVIIHLSPPL